MPNFMITTACNFRCAYCFGLDMIGPNHPAQHMKWETYIDLLKWIRKSPDPVSEIHLMGGEPTLSPLFMAMLNRGLEEGFQVKVFSNLSAPLDLQLLHETRQKKITWVINVNPLSFYRDEQLTLLSRHLGILRDWAVLTFNVTPAAQSYRHIFELIEQHGLQKSIKLGVALPTMEKNNLFVSRGRYAEVSATVLSIFEDACRAGISIEFECGVPYCVFSAEQLAQLKGIRISTCCSRLDITPDGRVINCLPLCKIAAVPYHRFPSYRDAREWFIKALTPYRSLGGQEECLTCIHRTDGKCFACLAFGFDSYNRIVFPPLPN